MVPLVLGTGVSACRLCVWERGPVCWGERWRERQPSGVAVTRVCLFYSEEMVSDEISTSM